MLIGHGNKDLQKHLFLDDGSTIPVLADQRTSYGKAAKEFNQAREALKHHAEQVVAQSQSIQEKNRLAVKLFIYKNLASKAGRVGWNQKDTGGYPIQNPDPKKYKQEVELA